MHFIVSFKIVSQPKDINHKQILISQVYWNIQGELYADVLNVFLNAF